MMQEERVFLPKKVSELVIDPIPNNPINVSQFFQKDLRNTFHNGQIRNPH